MKLLAVIGIIGGVLPVDEEIAVLAAECGMLALVLLAWIVGSDSRVHDEGQDLTQVLVDLA